MWRKKAWFEAWVLFWLLFSSLGAAVAQEEPPAPTPAPTVTPSTVPLADLVSRLEKEKDFIASLNLATPLSLTEDVREKAEDIEKRISSVVAAVEALSADRFKSSTFVEIAEIEERLLSERARLEELSEAVAERVTRLSAARERLRDTESRWAKTEQALSGELSEELRERLRLASSEVKKARQEVATRLDALLLVQSELSERTPILRETLAALRSGRETLRDNLFVRDGTPFYSARFWERLRERFLPSSGGSIESRIREMRKYFLGQDKSVLFHIVLAVLFLWLGFHVHRAGEENKSFPVLSEHPKLLGVLAALLVSFFLYPEAPQSFYQLVGLLMLVPLIRFFRLFAGEGYDLIIGGVATLYVLDFVRTLFDGSAGTLQLVFFFEMLAAAVVAWLMAHRCGCVGPQSDFREAEHRRLMWLVGQASRLGIFAFLAAAVLIFIGNYSLALIVGRTILGAVYSGAVLFVAYRLLRGLLQWFVDRRVFGSLSFMSTRKESFLVKLDKLTAFLLSLVWLGGVLTNVGLYQDLVEIFSAVFSYEITLGEISFRMGGVVSFVLILVIGYLVSRMLRIFLEEDVFPRQRFDLGIQYTISTMLHYGILTIAVLAALGSVGVGFQNIAIIAGALSVGIGFGLQTIVNNFVSGLILLFERPIKVGDLVFVGDLLGNVTRIGIRSSTIRTLDEAEIIVPNATLVSENVINWTLSSSRARLAVGVGVKYGTPAEKVIDLLGDAVKELPFVLEYPSPDVLFREFGDSSLNFLVRVWVKDVKKRPKHESALLVAIQKTLAEHDIEVPFPQRDLHIISDKIGFFSPRSDESE